MDQIPKQHENPKGLHQRYVIKKIVPVEELLPSFPKKYELKDVDDDAEYFVLRLDDRGSDPIHIAACRKAVLCYAEFIKDHLPELSKDLIIRYGS